MRYFKNIVIILTIGLALFSCQQSSINSSSDRKIFRQNQFTGITSLDPAFSKDQATMWATHQIFDGLVEVNEKLEVVPCIAKSWEMSDDGKTYTCLLYTF